MGGQYEVKDGAVKKYYSIAGMMVATQDASGLQYLLTDHLGSVVAVTNASGTLTSQQRYLPFGGTRTIPNSPILGTDFGYTGQRLLDSGMGGIMDYKARFYSPALGRFVQPDSIIPNTANPQNFNRFSYVGNNPVRFNDPTGHVCSDPDDPTPSCESGGSTVNAHGLGSSSVVITGDPLDDGLKQKKPKVRKKSCDTNGNGFADVPCRGLTTRDWDDGLARSSSDVICTYASLVECYYEHQLLDMGPDPMSIDPQEFQDLLLAIYFEMEGRSYGDLVLSSLFFDTPFFDRGRLYPGGALPGTGCLAESCYARHELNYAAQGIASAAAGETKFEGIMRIYAWKIMNGSWPSKGTIEMYNVGYDFAYAKNPDIVQPLMPGHLVYPP
jgi:RHS repeat-associated protein